MPLLVREAKLDDIPIIYKYIKDLAEYEKAPEEAILTEEDLKDFSPRYTAGLLLGE
jgi:N-acetylglutamate synthase-like GNAT family acetyltransferase